MQETPVRRPLLNQSNDQLYNLSEKIKNIEQQIQQINQQQQIPGPVLGAQNIQGQNINAQAQIFSGLRNSPIQIPCNQPIQNQFNQPIQNQFNQRRYDTQANDQPLRQRQFTPSANTNNSNWQQNNRGQFLFNNQNPNK